MDGKAERGLLPKRGEKGQEREFSPEQIQNAVEVIRSFAAQTMTGVPKATPPELYEAIQALTPQPFVEVILIDGKGRYALHRRPKNERHFGANRLHILGGNLKPDRKGMSMADAAREMARAEMGAEDLEYVAGPIASYQWKRGSEHPSGWPNSQVYVMKVVGNLPERQDIVWFDNNALPPEDEVIIGKAGDIHRNFLQVYQSWCKNPNQPCIDLNERPLQPSKES